MLRLISNPIILLIFTLLSIIFFISLDNTGKKRLQSAEIIAQNEEEIQAAGQVVRQLEEQAALAQSGFAREKIIRDQLLGVKEGEYVVQLPDLQPEEELDFATETAETPLEQWKRLLWR